MQVIHSIVPCSVSYVDYPLCLCWGVVIDVSFLTMALNLMSKQVGTAAKISSILMHSEPCAIALH